MKLLNNFSTSLIWSCISNQGGGSWALIIFTEHSRYASHKQLLFQLLGKKLISINLYSSQIKFVNEMDAGKSPAHWPRTGWKHAPCMKQVSTESTSVLPTNHRHYSVVVLDPKEIASSSDLIRKKENTSGQACCKWNGISLSDQPL